MSLSNQEKFVNSFWVIILLVAVGIYFWVIPKNLIAEAYSKKKHYNLKKTSRFLAVGFWIIAISCVPVLISLWFDTPWICIICVILLVLGTSVLHDYESGGKLKYIYSFSSCDDDKHPSICNDCKVEGCFVCFGYFN